MQAPQATAEHGHRALGCRRWCRVRGAQDGVQGSTTTVRGTVQGRLAPRSRFSVTGCRLGRLSPGPQGCGSGVVFSVLAPPAARETKPRVPARPHGPAARPLLQHSMVLRSAHGDRAAAQVPPLTACLYWSPGVAPTGQLAHCAWTPAVTARGAGPQCEWVGRLDSESPWPRGRAVWCGSRTRLAARRPCRSSALH